MDTGCLPRREPRSNIKHHIRHSRVPNLTVLKCDETSLAGLSDQPKHEYAKGDSSSNTCPSEIPT